MAVVVGCCADMLAWEYWCSLDSDVFDHHGIITFWNPGIPTNQLVTCIPGGPISCSRTPMASWKWMMSFSWSCLVREDVDGDGPLDDVSFCDFLHSERSHNMKILVRGYDSNMILRCCCSG